MQELIVTIVKGLVDDKDAVCVTVDLPKEDERLSTTSMSHQTIWVVSSENGGLQKQSVQS